MECNSSGIDTLILDWDGTLFRSFPAVVEAYKPISLELAGKELDIEWFISIYSPDYKQNLKNLGIPESQAERANKIFFEHFEPASDACKLFPGIERVVEGLSRYFPRMGIYTMSRKVQLEKHLKNKGLARFFHASVTEDDLICPGRTKSSLRKPNSFGLDLAISRLNSSPERTAYIGDAKIDFDTGRNAQVALVGLCTYGGFEKPEAIRALPADIYFDDPDQLLQLGEFRKAA